MISSQFPVTTLDDCIMELSCGEYQCFSDIDMKAAFWQVRVSDEDARKCAKQGPDGILLLLDRLAMGGKDSSAQLERLLVENFAMPFRERFKDSSIVIDRDNIFLASMTEEHAQAIEFIAERASLFKVKFGSGNIGTSKLDILGFEMTTDDIRPAVKAIEKIKQMAKSKNKKDVRAILGSLNFYRWMIPQFAGRVKPLEELIKKDVKFEWTDSLEKTFEELKTIMATCSMAKYDRTKPVEIFTDASDTAAGAALIQEGRVVKVFSRKFRGAQLRYSVTRREALAVIWAVRFFRDKFRGPKTPVYTDHMPLIGWSRGAATEDNLLLRWGLILQEYDVEVKYIPGESNTSADMLSRIQAQREQPSRAAKEFFKGKPRPSADPHERRNWLVDLHSALMHPGTRTMLQMVREEWNWPTMQEEIEDVTKHCDVCQRQERGPNKVPATIVTSRSNWEVMDELSIDLIVDLPETPRGFKHILVVVDGFSGFPEGYPLKDKGAKDVSGCLLDCFFRFGFPRIIR